MNIQKTLNTSRSKRVTLNVFMAIGLLGACVGGYAYYRYNQPDTERTVANTQTGEQKAITVEPASALATFSEIPTRLRIDTIAVDAPIEQVGLTADGAMDAPAILAGVGWYTASAKAGEDTYSVLLDGHYGSARAPGVFYRLRELAVGNTMTLGTEKGTQLTYKVVEIEQKLLEQVDMKKALMPYRQGVQSLTIITCEGIYDSSRATYNERTVVYAERVS